MRAHQQHGARAAASAGDDRPVSQGGGACKRSGPPGQSSDDVTAHCQAYSKCNVSHFCVLYLLVFYCGINILSQCFVESQYDLSPFKAFYSMMLTRHCHVLSYHLIFFYPRAAQMNKYRDAFHESVARVNFVKTVKS